MILADHTRIGEVSRVSVCTCQEIAVLVTDAAAELSTQRAAGPRRVVRA